MHGTFKDIKMGDPLEQEELSRNPARGIVIGMAIMLPIYALAGLAVLLLH